MAKWLNAHGNLFQCYLTKNTKGVMTDHDHHDDLLCRK